MALVKNSSPPAGNIGGKFQNLGMSVVKFFSLTTDTFLLFVLFVLTFRLLFSVSPQFNNSEFSKLVDQTFAPFTSALKPYLQQFGIPSSVIGLNISLVPVFLLVILVRNLLNWQLARMLRQHLNPSQSGGMTLIKIVNEVRKEDTVRRKTTERRLAIQAYTEVKDILESSNQELTFVALDVVGSTKMKIGEDPIVIEQTFINYRSLVEGLLQKFQCYKCTWTPDGQMAAFKTSDLGVLFAKGVLGALPEFNRKLRLKTSFKLRVGVNSGVVSTDDATPMEKISSFSIDLTGHLQKYAEPDSMWISEKTFNTLAEKEGFVAITQKVDDTNVYSWKCQ